MKKLINLPILLIFVGLSLQAQEAKIEIEQPVYVDDDTISGTLLTHFPLDSRKIKKQPLVIFIAGSGPTDRDGNSAFLGGSNDAYRLLADSLYQSGVSTYRYDKMGVGASSTTTNEADLRFSSNIKVVQAIYEKIEEIGFKKIYILGHSEGSLVGMLASQHLDVEGFISVAGSGRSYYTLLEEQLSKQLPEAQLKSAMNKLDSIRNGHLVTNYPNMLASLMRESVQPYLRDLLNYSPTDEIAKLDVPVLIIQGAKDLQATETDSEALKEARPEATYHLYPEMNHVLKVVKSQEENMASYTDPDFPLQPEIAEDIASWIEEN